LAVRYDVEAFMKRLMILAMLALSAAPLAGCVVYPAQPHHGAVWVPGHYGPYGYWVRGHWA
jgi:hypothetical protein